MTLFLTILLLITSAFTGYLTIAGKTCSTGGGSIFGRLTARGWVATFCIVITAICGVALSLLNEKISAQRDERQKRIDELAIESRLPGVEGMHAKELLALERNSKLISKSKDDADDWVNNYLSNFSKTGGNYASSEELKESLANELHIFWLPHVEVVMSGFRKRAEAIAKKFNGHFTESPQERIVLVAYSRQRSPISEVNLPDGSSLTLNLSPGLVTDTERIPPVLLIYAGTTNYNDNALGVGFNGQNAIQITNGGGPFEGRFKEYKASVPITEDNSYIEHLNESLNAIFEVWLNTVLKNQTIN